MPKERVRAAKYKRAAVKIPGKPCPLIIPIKTANSTRKYDSYSKAAALFFPGLTSFMRKGGHVDPSMLFKYSTIMKNVLPQLPATARKTYSNLKVQQLLLQSMETKSLFLYDMLHFLIHWERITSAEACLNFLEHHFDFDGKSMEGILEEIRVMLDVKYGCIRSLSSFDIYSLGLTAYEFKILQDYILNCDKNSSYLCMRPGSFHQASFRSLLPYHYALKNAVLELRESFLAAPRPIKYIMVPVLYSEGDNYLYGYYMRVNLDEFAVDWFDHRDRDRSHEAGELARCFTYLFTFMTPQKSERVNQLPLGHFEIGSGQTYPQVETEVEGSTIDGPCSLVGLYILRELVAGQPISSHMSIDRRNKFAQELADFLTSKL